MKPLRLNTPKRTCELRYRDYHSFKSALRTDFFRTCGYCGDIDLACGGSRAFHIDHFKPIKLYKKLACDYSNLVYACAYCNISKSDDWPCEDPGRTYKDGKGYVDPCDADFHLHLERDDDGRIVPKTDIGKYMYDKLSLGLLRHELIWLLTTLFAQMKEIQKLYQEHRHGPKANAIMRQLMDLFDEYVKYKGYFEDTL